MPAVKEKVSFCPFGCGTAQCDENGHCDHLVGFSNDGKTFEPNVAAVNPVTRETTGLRQTVGDNHLKGYRNVRPVMPSDVLVNPEDQQFDNGAWHTRQRWVSARVYRQLPLDHVPPVNESPAPEKPMSYGPPLERAKPDEPPSWARQLLASVEDLHSRIDSIEDRQATLENAVTAPPAAIPAAVEVSPVVAAAPEPQEGEELDGLPDDAPKDNPPRRGKK